MLRRVNQLVAGPHSIITNTVAATTGRVVNMLAGLVATALIARLLGPDDFGLYVALISYGTIVQLLADAGLYLTLTREIARSPDQQDTLLRHVISLRLVLLVAAFGIGLALLPWVSGDKAQSAYFWLVAGLICQSLSQLYMGIFQHHQQVWRATVGDLLGRAAQIIGLSLLALQHHVSLTTSLGAFALGSVIAFLLHRRLLPRPHAVTRGFTPTTWSRLLRTSWPLGVMLVLNAIYFRLDLIMLHRLTDGPSAGWYGVAYRIMESTLFFPAILGGLLLPRLSEAWTRADHHRTRQFIIEGLKLAALSSGAIIVGLITASSAIVMIVGGDNYAAAAPLLNILSVALIIMFIGNIFGFALVALERQTTLLRLYAALVLFNAAANFLVIPRWGATGAALTTIATEFIAATTAGIVLTRMLQLPLPWRYALRCAAAAALALVAGSLLPPRVPGLLRGLLAVGLYGVLAWSLYLTHSHHRRLLITSRPSPLVHTSADALIE